MKLLSRLLYLLALTALWLGVIFISEDYGQAMFVTGLGFILGYEIAGLGERW